MLRRRSGVRRSGPSPRRHEGRMGRASNAGLAAEPAAPPARRQPKASPTRNAEHAHARVDELQLDRRVGAQ